MQCASVRCSVLQRRCDMMIWRCDMMISRRCDMMIWRCDMMISLVNRMHSCHLICHLMASNMSCVRRVLSLSHACAQTRNLLWLLVCNRVCDRVFCNLSPTSCGCWCAIGSLLQVAQYIYTPLSPPPPLPLSLFPIPAHPSTPLSDVHSPNHPLICTCLCGHSLQYNVLARVR